MAKGRLAEAKKAADDAARYDEGDAVKAVYGSLERKADKLIEKYRGRAEALADEVAENGGQQESGDWTVSYIVEAAEPWFEAHGGDERFREPAAGETHHIEIIPQETETGRIVPDVPITLQVVDAEGKVVDEKELNFLHSTFFHYANNFEVPVDGTYTLRATLGSPTFARHGEEGEEPALAEGTELEFEDVDLTQE